MEWQWRDGGRTPAQGCHERDCTASPSAAVTHPRPRPRRSSLALALDPNPAFVFACALSPLQFEMSPFCDKVRRALRYKGVPFTVREWGLVQLGRPGPLCEHTTQVSSWPDPAHAALSAPASQAAGARDPRQKDPRLHRHSRVPGGCVPRPASVRAPAAASPRSGLRSCANDVRRTVAPNAPGCSSPTPCSAPSATFSKTGTTITTHE